MVLFDGNKFPHSSTVDNAKYFEDNVTETALLNKRCNLCFFLAPNEKNKQHCDLQVVDNFLPEGEFKRMQTLFNDNNFGWYRHEGISGDDATMTTTQTALDNYYFGHLLYIDYRIMSNYYDEVMGIIERPLRERLGHTFNQINRMKVNLYPRTAEVQVHPWHVDSNE